MPNLLDRNFTADQPNQNWVGDISHIWANEGLLYQAVISGLHSLRLIGRAGSIHVVVQTGHSSAGKFILR